MSFSLYTLSPSSFSTLADNEITVEIYDLCESWREITERLRSLTLDVEENSLDTLSGEWVTFTGESSVVTTGNLVRVKKNDRLLFYGTIVDLRHKRTVEGEILSFKALGIGERLVETTVDRVYIDKTAGEIVTDLLSDTGLTLGQIDDIVRISYFRATDTILSSIRRLCDLVDGIFFVTPDGVAYFLDRSTSIYPTLILDGTRGKEILDLSIGRELYRQYNQVRVIGGVVGGQRIQVVARDESSIQSLGKVIEEVIEDNTILDVGLAKKIAESRLNRYKSSRDRSSIQTSLKLPVRAGQYARILVGDTDETKIISKVTHKLLEGISELQLGLGEISEYERTQEIEEREWRILKSIRYVTEQFHSLTSGTPYTVEVLLESSDYLELSNVWFNEDGELELTDGSTSGYAVFEYIPEEETFFSWIEVTWNRVVTDTANSSISLQVEDEFGNPIGTVSENLYLLPYPISGDLCEKNASDWTVVNGSAKDVSSRVVSDRSVRFSWTVSTDRYAYLNVNLDLSSYRFVRLYLKQNSTESVEFRLYTDDSNYYYIQLQPTESWRWEEFKISLSDLYSVGSPSLSNITKLEFRYPSTDSTTLYTFVDGLSFWKVGKEKLKFRVSFNRSDISVDSPVFRWIRVTYSVGVM